MANPLNKADVTAYVEENIAHFHAARLAVLDSLSLAKVLQRKNPYLFKAKNVGTAEEIVRVIIDATLSSSEETIFGDWLEGLAIFVNKKVYGGFKSSSKGIDLEFDLQGIRYIVAIKSGPKWGNSSQIAKMKSDFISAVRTLHTSSKGMNVRAINGCCYGRTNATAQNGYEKLCGERFWTFISGDKDFYLDIIEPLGHDAKKKNDDFADAYAKKVNLFTKEFIEEFCLPTGAIDWDKIVRMNSAINPPKLIKRKKNKSVPIQDDDDDVDGPIIDLSDPIEIDLEELLNS